MDERLEDTWQTTERLQARARELRAEAAETDIKGIHDTRSCPPSATSDTAAGHVSSA
jgi:hypothetical protein